MEEKEEITAGAIFEVAREDGIQAQVEEMTFDTTWDIKYRKGMRVWVKILVEWYT